MKRVLISADMEGATGTVLPTDVAAGTPEYQRFRRLLTGDVNAAVAGFADAGADEVIVNDAHCGMNNVLIEELDPRALLITGRHKPLGMMQGLEDGVDAVAFVGYHTGAGEQGVLAHTYLSHSILGVRIDGRPADEGTLNALVAAEAGIPVVLVTGDDATCHQAAVYAPGCRTVAVKRAISRHAAVCRTPAATSAEIRREAAAALGAPLPRPATEAAGHVVEIDLDSPHQAERACSLPGVTASGPRRVRLESPDAREALRRFRALTWVIGGGREGDWT
ncbi:M55 family metallopeptidase [Streptomyces cacaoi]|uniref:M55 family metallopeptidase n=1 Tax=Streptomyces cacaoi TaxID=1898 RepID=UPI00262BAD8E|nr:M55 family metallopeptidase [Streptomyces cacaoi]